MSKRLPISCETFTYPTNHTQWRYFCWTLYIGGVKFICTGGHISLAVAFKGRNVILTP